MDSALKKWHCSKRSPGAHWTGSAKVQPCASRSGLFEIGWSARQDVSLVRCYKNFEYAEEGTVSEFR